jgi:hypothetical protein
MVLAANLKRVSDNQNVKLVDGRKYPKGCHAARQLEPTSYFKTT